MTQSRGISLLEVSLAVSVGLMLTAGSVYAYRQHMHATRVTQAKLMLSTLRQAIEMQRYRTGSFPTVVQLRANTDERGNGYYGAAGSLLRDPLHPPMNAAAASPIKNLAAAEATGSPWGGWGYHQTTGYLEPNLDPTLFPGDRPSAW